MDYEKLKEEIKQISDICKDLPEQFRERCFDLLLQNLLNSLQPAAKAHDSQVHKKEAPVLPSVPPAPKNGKIPIKSQLRVFMQRHDISEDDLNRLALFEDEQVHFIVEPNHGKIARGQVEWALLLALKSAIVSNAFAVDPEDVRSICQEKGYYDKANFAATFKREPGVKYFREALEPQGSTQPLTNEGQAALAKLIKDLLKSE